MKPRQPPFASGATLTPNVVTFPWRSAEASCRVAISSELVDNLRQEAIQALLAIPRRGLEIGGVLFGEVIRESPDTLVFRVTEQLEIPCEHSSGPSYITNERDRASLAAILTRHYQSDPASSHTVGFYRSYTGREPFLDDADRELIELYFPTRPFVCVLLQPLSVTKCLATLRVWNEDSLLPDAGSTPFSFEAPPPGQSPHSEPARATTPPVPENTSSEQPSPAEDSAAARPLFTYTDDEAPSTTSLRRSLILPLLCLLFVFGLAVSYRLGASRREISSPPVRLDARLSDGNLLLNWDASSPAVKKALRAVLLVNDGPNPRSIQLDARQLRRGHYLYPAPQTDSLFRLRIYGPDASTAADSLRVIAPRTAVTPAAQSAHTPPTETALQAPEPSLKPDALSSSKTPLPIARHQVLPVISPGIRTRIKEPVSIEVFVQVNQFGRVTNASSRLTTPGLNPGLNRYLANQAANAARQWTFWPARSSDGAPIAAGRFISFEITP